MLSIRLNTIPWLLRAVALALVIAGCGEPTAPPRVVVGGVERALVEEIVTQTALSGIWAGTRSGAALAPAVYHVGMAHTLPGADAGLLIAIAVTEYGTWPLNCGPPVAGQPWRGCWQLSTTRADWAEGTVRIVSPDGGQALTYPSTRLGGEFRFAKPPASTWRIDFRAGIPPTAAGRFDDAVTFVPSSGSAAVDLSYSGTTTFVWVNSANATLDVYLEFPRLHSCGTVTVDLRDDGHDVVEGTIKCGSTTLGRISAGAELYSFTWLP